MAFKSLATKGVALSMHSQCSSHSRRASSHANSAISALRSAKSKRDVDQKLNSIIDGMVYLSNAVKEVSDSVTPIAKMNMASAILSENIGGLLEQQQAELVSLLAKTPKR